MAAKQFKAHDRNAIRSEALQHPPHRHRRKTTGRRVRPAAAIVGSFLLNAFKSDDVQIDVFAAVAVRPFFDPASPCFVGGFLVRILRMLAVAKECGAGSGTVQLIARALS
jgi:hypothetical protein